MLIKKKLDFPISISIDFCLIPGVLLGTPGHGEKNLSLIIGTYVWSFYILFSYDHYIATVKVMFTDPTTNLGWMHEESYEIF
jgi:hypothetical protein